jgi:hypothetical protein
MERLERGLRREAKRLGIPAAAGLVEDWPGLVGDLIAANAWPARLTRDGVLHVNTSSSTWAFELKHLAPEILERMRRKMGGGVPRDLRFKAGPLPETSFSSGCEGGGRAPEVGEQERALAGELTASIENEELRALVARAAAASLAQAAEKRP